MDFLNKLYESNLFGIGLFAVISFLVVTFLIVLFFGKKDEKKRKLEEVSEFEVNNENAFKETTNPVSLETTTPAQTPNINELNGTTLNTFPEVTPTVPTPPVAPVTPINVAPEITPIANLNPIPTNNETIPSMSDSFAPQSEPVTPIVTPEVPISPIEPTQPINNTFETPNITPIINTPEVTPIINTPENNIPIFEPVTSTPIIEPIKPIINEPTITEPVMNQATPVNTPVPPIITETTSFNFEPEKEEERVTEPISNTYNNTYEPPITPVAPVIEEPKPVIPSSYPEQPKIIEEPTISDTYYQPIERPETSEIKVPSIDFDAIAKSISAELDDLESRKRITPMSEINRLTPEPLPRDASPVYVNTPAHVEAPTSRIDLPKKIDLPTKKQN